MGRTAVADVDTAVKSHVPKIHFTFSLVRSRAILEAIEAGINSGLLKPETLALASAELEKMKVRAKKQEVGYAYKKLEGMNYEAIEEATEVDSVR